MDASKNAREADWQSDSQLKNLAMLADKEPRPASLGREGQRVRCFRLGDITDDLQHLHEVHMVYSDNELEDDEYPTCPTCNGELATQPHWSYWFCDTCGHKEHLEQEEP